MRKTEDKDKDFIDEIMTATLSFLISNIGDNKDVKPSDLDNLKGSDLDYIRDNAPVLATADLKVEHKCSKCDKDFDTELPVLAADFLLRSRT